MLTTTTAFDNTVKKSSVQAKADVVIEHSWTHLSNTVTAGNDAGAAGLDEELFPIESIIKLDPPITGAPFAITDEADTFDNETTDTHYRVVGEDMNFTYWISANVSGGGGAITDVKPYVDWDTPQETNHILAHFDITASPISAIDVYTKATVGGAWTLQVSDVAPDSDGVLSLHYHGGTSWTTTSPATNTSTIAGVMLHVKTLANVGNYVHLISLDGSLIRNVTSDIISLDISKSRAEQDAMTPMGLNQTNTLSLSLDDSTLSTYPIERNTKIVVQLGYDTTAEGGTANDLVPAGTFFVDSFSTSHLDATVSINASDRSRLLQEQFSANALLIDGSYKFVINELLRRNGISGFTFRFQDAANINRTYKIPYVWWTEDETIWEILNQIVRSEMGFFFVNEEDEIEIVDYDHWALSATSQFTFNNSDIIDLSSSYEIEANDVTVNYNIYAESFSETSIINRGVDSDGEVVITSTSRVPVTQILWSPSDTVVLGSAVLQNDINDTDPTPPIRITWNTRDQIPLDKGEVNIEGEYFTYDGKTESAGVYVELATTARALRGSTARWHRQDTSGWLKTREYPAGYNGTYTTESMTFSDGKLNAKLTESTSTNTAYVTWQKMYHPDTNYSGTNYNVWGTKLTLKDHTPGVPIHNMAGLFLQDNAVNNEGYYFEVVGIETIERSGFTIGSLRFYKSNADFSTRNGLPNTPEGLAGYFFIIPSETPIELEVYQDLGVPGKYVVFANGVFIADFTDNTYTPYERFGVYVRGNTKAEFEFLYAGSTTTNPDIARYRGRNSITGGYLSQWRNANPESIDYYTEFQPDVREVREFEVDYSIYPALSAQILNVNDLESRILSNEFTPFNAKFTIENTSHESAVLHGTDVDVSPGFEVNTKLAVYGPALILEASEQVRVKDNDSIRKRGIHSIEIDSSWIQSKDRASVIGEHIKNEWKTPVEFLELSCVPNPALQPGDRVTITWTERGITGDYYIVSSNISFDGGFSGSMQVRSV